MNLQLEHELVKFRDKIKKEADQEYDFACINENINESKIELAFSEKLLKFSNELGEIINNERLR